MICLPRGIPHEFRNISAKSGTLLAVFSPATVADEPPDAVFVNGKQFRGRNVEAYQATIDEILKK